MQIPLRIAVIDRAIDRTGCAIGIAREPGLHAKPEMRPECPAVRRDNHFRPEMIRRVDGAIPIHGTGVLGRTQLRIQGLHNHGLQLLRAARCACMEGEGVSHFRSMHVKAGE